MNYDTDDDAAGTALSLFVLLICGIVVFIMAMLVPAPAHALECAERPNGKTYWSYRIIDGERCWYRGHRVIPKSRLHWPDEPKPKKLKGDPVFNQIRAEEKPAAPRMEAPLRSDASMNIVIDGCCWPVLTEFDLRWAGDREQQ